MMKLVYSTSNTIWCIYNLVEWFFFFFFSDGMVEWFSFLFSDGMVEWFSIN